MYSIFYHVYSFIKISNRIQNFDLKVRPKKKVRQTFFSKQNQSINVIHITPKIYNRKVSIKEITKGYKQFTTSKQIYGEIIILYSNKRNKKNKIISFLT